MMCKPEKQVRSCAEAIAQNANTYTVPVTCENCRFEGEIILAKGKSVSQAICQTCGCGELRPRTAGELQQAQLAAHLQRLEIVDIYGSEEAEHNERAWRQTFANVGQPQR